MILLLSFPFGYLLFIFFLPVCCGLDYVELVRVGILVLFLILEGRLFTSEFDISYGFVIYALY